MLSLLEINVKTHSTCSKLFATCLPTHSPNNAEYVQKMPCCGDPCGSAKRTRLVCFTNVRPGANMSTCNSC